MECGTSPAWWAVFGVMSGVIAGLLGLLTLFVRQFFSQQEMAMRAMNLVERQTEITEQVVEK